MPAVPGQRQNSMGLYGNYKTDFSMAQEQTPPAPKQEQLAKLNEGQKAQLANMDKVKQDKQINHTTVKK